MAKEKPLRKLRHNLALVRKLIIEKDLDFLLVVTGRERVGKSSLALHIATEVDPKFTVDQIVFDIPSLYKQVYSLEKGQCVIIDEGATSFFSRDAMSTDVKEGVKLLTVMGERNLFVILCVPSFHLIDKYIRENRVSALIKVVSRGKMWLYSRQALKAIFKNERSHRFSWGSPSMQDSFPKFTGEMWDKYTEKKSGYLTSRTDKVMAGHEEVEPDAEEGVYVRRKKALAKLQVSDSTLLRLVEDGKVKRINDAAGRYCYRWEDLCALNSNRVVNKDSKRDGNPPTPAPRGKENLEGNTDAAR